MCLSTVKTTYDKPSDLIVDGWKEFGGTASSLKFLNFIFSGKLDVPLDQWITAEHPGASIRASDGKLYVPGFHIYAEEGVWNRRVYLRRVTCIGDQDGRKTVIAQEMYVPSNPNDWPPKDKALAPRKKLIDRIRKP